MIEPLAESAPLARSLADAHCRRDPATGETCAWYHGLWQDLRLLGIAASPALQADLLTRAFARVSGPRPRVLVSGAADYALLAQVLAACDAAGVDPEVTVLDLCDTPLLLSAWYAARMGRVIGTVRADIFEHRADAAYDVICSHSFVGLFPPAQRRALFARWTAMLAPSGAAIVVSRVRGGDPERPLGFGAAEAAAFRAAVEQRMRGGAPASPAEIAGVLGRVDTYVARIHVHPLPQEELTALFEGAGLDVEASELMTSSASQNAGLGGIAVPANATHACVVGRKA